MPSILLISTLNTKGEETAYLRDRLKALGSEIITMDLSMQEGSLWKAEIPPRNVAEAGGGKWEEILSSTDRAKSTEVMIRGAIKKAKELWERGEIQGVIGIGGSTGSLMATEVMRALPFGVPKLMISSTAALPGLSTRYIGTGDIMLFHSVIEISGLSDLLKNVLDRAALSMHEMARGQMSSIRTDTDRKRIAMTMLGPCEGCAHRVREALEREGLQVIGFSAAGIGDRAMDEMILQGLFHGVVELAPGGIGEHMFGGMRDAGPQRIEAACSVGIPQVITLCSVNHLTIRKSKYKPSDYQRPMYHLDRYRTWLRTTEEELYNIGKEFGKKLNRAKAEVVILFPQKGWSSVDRPGNPTYNPEQDRIFLKGLEENLTNNNIEIIEVDANLEDKEFSDALISAAKRLFLNRKE